jgi:hypothetical protein
MRIMNDAANRAAAERQMIVDEKSGSCRKHRRSDIYSPITIVSFASWITYFLFSPLVLF